MTSSPLKLTAPLALALLLAPALLAPALAQGTIPAPVLPAPVVTPAVAPAAPVAAPQPVAWTRDALSTATFVVQDPVWEGSTALVTTEQRGSIVSALKRDSAGAIKRHYPSAKLVESTAPEAAGAVKVTPVLTAPAALVPWANLSARLDITLPQGEKKSLAQSFSVLTLWQRGAEAANYAFDQVAQQLP